MVKYRVGTIWGYIILDTYLWNCKLLLVQQAIQSLMTPNQTVLCCTCGRAVDCRCFILARVPVTRPVLHKDVSGLSSYGPVYVARCSWLVHVTACHMADAADSVDLTSLQILVITWCYQCPPIVYMVVDQPAALRLHGRDKFYIATTSTHIFFQHDITYCYCMPRCSRALYH